MLNTSGEQNLAMDQHWQEVERAIATASGRAFRIDRVQAVGGGCINDALCLSGGGKRYFVKLNSKDQLPLFEAEMDGLEAIRASATLRVPEVICCGSDGERAWLVLEYLGFASAGKGARRRLGEGLAAMHAQVGDHFGWPQDNFIGATVQDNRPSEDWIAFYRDYRLARQLDLAEANGAPGRLLDQGRELLEVLPRFFSAYRPAPALLHGDLWGGNWSVLESGEAVVFDPAVYRGDREADIAMSELFGGFGQDFYAAYQHHLPLDPGYRTRRELYNLYHLLNHFNLFGGAYASQSQSVIEHLLAQ